MHTEMQCMQLQLVRLSSPQGQFNVDTMPPATTHLGAPCKQQGHWDPAAKSATFHAFIYSCRAVVFCSGATNKATTGGAL